MKRDVTSSVFIVSRWSLTRLRLGLISLGLALGFDQKGSDSVLWKGSTCSGVKLGSGNHSPCVKCLRVSFVCRKHVSFSSACSLSEAVLAHREFASFLDHFMIKHAVLSFINKPEH